MARKDDRLYARFTLDFADHPKIFTLSDSAFRTLVEMVLWSRSQMTDGEVKESFALKRWPSESLSELLTNDEASASLSLRDGSYWIHDFCEQQETRAEIEARKARNSENGRKGGLKRPKKSESLSESVSKSLSESLSETEAETETETETLTTSNEVVINAPKRASKISPSFAITPEMRQWAAEQVPLVNIDAKLPEFIDYWIGTGKAMKDWVATWRNGMRRLQGFAECDASKARGPDRKLTNAEMNLANLQSKIGGNQNGFDANRNSLESRLVG